MKSLSFCKFQVSDDILECVSHNCPNFEELKIDGKLGEVKVSSLIQVAKNCAKFPSSLELSFQEDKMGGESEVEAFTREYYCRLRKLELFIFGEEMGKFGQVEFLEASKIEKITIRKDSENNIMFFEKLNTFSKLRKLELNFKTEISTKVLFQLETLEHLDVRNSGLKQIEIDCPNLTYLSTRLGKDDVKLHGAPKLKKHSHFCHDIPSISDFIVPLSKTLRLDYVHMGLNNWQKYQFLFSFLFIVTTTKTKTTKYTHEI